ncbi:hypothetical protein Dimus_018668, partial [Dionaea muscipula]
MLPIDPSSTTSQLLAYETAKWTLMPYHNMLLAGTDKAAKEAMRHEWKRGVMTAKDQSIWKNLDD